MRKKGDKSKNRLEGKSPLSPREGAAGGEGRTQCRQDVVTAAAWGALAPAAVSCGVDESIINSGYPGDEVACASA